MQSSVHFIVYISVINNYRIVIGKILNLKPNHIVLHAVVSHIHYAKLKSTCTKYTS